MEKEPSAAVVTRSQVNPEKDYHKYRDVLRFDFWYSCAYCTLTELEAAGIGFEIEHYLPMNSHPELISDYHNLMWSCELCNRYKSSYSPNEKQRNHGNYVVRPDREDPRKHFYLEGLRLVEKTQTGYFNIELLDLNRKVLIKLREIRKRFWDSNQYILEGIRELKKLKIDLVDPRKRLIFQKIRKEVIQQKELIDRTFENIIREFARSPFLELDEEKEKRIKKRREFLKEQRAIGQDLA